MDENELRARLREAAVVPILTVHDLDKSRADVDRMVERGAGAIEILFRTPLAPALLAQARQRHPGCLFGAGTMFGPDTMAMAMEAGADFTVSPGLTPALAEAARASRLPMIPGALTASEVMCARELGFRLLKYYPAQPSNGLDVLADYRFVFPDVDFLATGKVGPDNLALYGRLPNLAAVGGPWMLEPDGDLAADITAFHAARKG